VHSISLTTGCHRIPTARCEVKSWLLGDRIDIFSCLWGGNTSHSPILSPARPVNSGLAVPSLSLFYSLFSLIKVCDVLLINSIFESGRCFKRWPWGLHGLPSLILEEAEVFPAVVKTSGGGPEASAAPQASLHHPPELFDPTQ
jgi:hypothetical protein